jgi:flagellar biosynthetic protein FliP
LPKRKITVEKRKIFWWSFAITALIGLFPLVAWSQTLPLVTSKQGGGGTIYAVPVKTVSALTALSFLPAALVLMTSFTRILIVFSLLRQALGLTTMPPNIVLIGRSPSS